MFVKGLIGDLFNKLKKDNISELIKPAIVHYEIEFIHPFSDGNGRMGRLWQHLLLTKVNGIFEYVPTESIIRERPKKYYSALEKSDHTGSCTPFVEFMLQAILDATMDYLDSLGPQPQTTETRIAFAKENFGNRFFHEKIILT